jgi:hypothetical protein
MDLLDIEPSHILGLESIPFFVGEAMARGECIGVLLVLREGFLRAHQLNNRGI